MMIPVVQGYQDTEVFDGVELWPIGKPIQGHCQNT